MSKFVFKLAGWIGAGSILLDQEDEQGLRRLSKLEFDTFTGLYNELGKFNSYVSKHLRDAEIFCGVHVEELPFTIDKLAVLYKGNRYIGNLEIIN